MMSSTLAITTVDNFKTWLNTNNIKAKYVLAIPTVIILQDETQEHLNALENAISYEDETNIYAECISGNQPFIINASALSKEE